MLSTEKDIKGLKALGTGRTYLHFRKVPKDLRGGWATQKEVSQSWKQRLLVQDGNQGTTHLPGPIG